MARPYSMDLRERVVRAVEEDGLSRRGAAARYGVSESAAIKWVKRFRTTGSVAPGQMGGHRPKKIRGAHRSWLLERCRRQDFTLRGLVVDLAERGLEVDYRTVWNFVHEEKLSFKKKACAPVSATARTSPDGAASGRSIARASPRSGWSSSTRPGPRPTWRRSGDGRRGAKG